MTHCLAPLVGAFINSHLMNINEPALVGEGMTGKHTNIYKTYVLLKQPI